MVILLHREDAYERESPRAGEADLIVAKHRNGPTATVTVAFQGHYSRFVDMAPADGCVCRVSRRVAESHVEWRKNDGIAVGVRQWGSHGVAVSSEYVATRRHH